MNTSYILQMIPPFAIPDCVITGSYGAIPPAKILKRSKQTTKPKRKKK